MHKHKKRKMIKEFLLGLGIIGTILLIIIIAFIPLLCTIILGTYFATTLGLTGIVWWAFIIIFYLVVMGIISTLA